MMIGVMVVVVLGDQSFCGNGVRKGDLLQVVNEYEQCGC